jgi:hypothetical protein
MIGSARSVTCAASEPIRVLHDEDAASVFCCKFRSSAFGGRQLGSTVAVERALVLVLILADDLPTFPFGHRTTIRHLRDERAALVLGAFRGVDDRERCARLSHPASLLSGLLPQLLRCRRHSGR